MFSQFENNSVNAFQYEWDFGDNTGLSINDNPGHVYTVPGVFDVSLVAVLTPVCADTLTIPEFVTVAGPEADFSLQYDPSCIPQPIMLFAESDKPYDYVWDFGNGELDSTSVNTTSDSIMYEYTSPGTYATKLIITDDKGCTRSFSEESITVHDVLLDLSIADSVICGVSTPILLENMSTGTTNDVTYEWIVQGAVDTISAAGFETTVNLPNSGKYDVVLIAEYGSCIDTLVKEDLFEVGHIPEPAFEQDQSQFCRNVDIHFLNTSTIQSGSIAEYLWNFPDGTISIEETPTYYTSSTEAATIDLMVTSNLGCTAQTNRTFEPAPGVEAFAGPDQLICLNDLTSLDGSLSEDIDGTTYYWSEVDGLSCSECLTPDVTVLDTTSYVLTAIHPNGCVSTDTVVIRVAPIPSPEITLSADSIICLGSSAIILVQDYDPSYTYTWDPSVLGLNCYSNCPIITATPLLPTSYPVAVSNVYGCLTNDSIFIDVESTYEPLVDDRKAICEASSTTLGTIAGDSPVWEYSSTLSCTNCPTPVASPEESTYYYVNALSPLGCSYRDSILVAVIPDGTADAGKDLLICAGETVAVNAIGSGTASWSPVELFANPTSLASEATPLETSVLSLSMTDDECTQNDSLIVEVMTKASIEAFGDTICYGEEAFIKQTGLTDKTRWFLNGELISKDEEVYINPDQSSIYTAVGYFRTCEPDTALAPVKVHEYIDFEFEDSQYEIHLNSDIDLVAQYDPERDYIYDWSPSVGLSCNNCPEPEIRDIPQSTNYELTIVDLTSGCSEKKNIGVRLVNTCDGSVIGMPNIFSQSGPTASHGFGPITENKDEFISLSLFDRWGNLMFQTTDVDEKWHGTINGKKAAIGVYVYVMNLTCPQTGENYKVMGDVTLVR